MPSWVVIGLSGVTNSGKTSLSRGLAGRYRGTREICQDHYFLPVSSPKHVLVEEVNHFNWELMSALDMDKMVADVHAIIDRYDLYFCKPFIFVIPFYKWLNIIKINSISPLPVETSSIVGSCRQAIKTKASVSKKQFFIYFVW